MASKKKQKVKWRQEGGRMVATLPNSVQDQLKSHHRASREAAIEAGTLGQRPCGTGVHGGSKRDRNRRDRRASRQEARRGFEE